MFLDSHVLSLIISFILSTTGVGIEEFSSEQLYNYGVRHFYGLEGVNEDWERAAFFFQEAVNRDGDMSSKAQLDLLRYYQDEGFQSWLDMHDWLQEAALEGDEKAQYSLSVLYFFGIGLDRRNPHEAKKWAGESASQDFLPAHSLLVTIEHVLKWGGY